MCIRDRFESGLFTKIDIVKKIQSESRKTTRNVLITTDYDFGNQICKNEHNSEKPKNCIDKKIFDPDVHILNYDHFFGEVKKLVCN